MDARKKFVLLSICRHFSGRATVRRIWMKKRNKGANLIREMRLHNHDDFIDFFRMSPEVFDKLISMVGPKLQKQYTSFREPISARQRLEVTLRYLVSGDSYKSLETIFHISISSICRIVRETCKALLNVLQPMVLPVPTEDQWRRIASEMEELWQFPHCLGALDGRHVIMQAPPKTGSHSIVVIAVCDARYRFTFIDIGERARDNDNTLFKHSKFNRALLTGQLRIPPAECHGGMGGTDMPYVFVADEAFPLKINIMKPYPGRTLTTDRTIFNYRLSRAKRLIENSFGVMSARFRIYRRPIAGKVNTVETIVKTTVCLHNFLKSVEDDLPPSEKRYCPPGFHDSEDQNKVVSEGSWRSVGASKGLLELSGSSADNFLRKPKQVRDAFKDYFNGPGSVGWQRVISSTD
ncbi:putative nuclease harbi1 [Caerostris extrusa]|uniref:Nuclease harbi1 n=1 Tax=Caerostris extrusa TaxID=172846 RepID=A0AAV4VYJ4_CAEEX|nr:putative nuclease harbi1 [Caerostris extrusa]